jgi:hypothetical protein
MRGRRFEEDWADELLEEEEETPRRRRVVDDNYEIDESIEDDEWADPYLRAVNAQRRKREGLPPGRDLHYDERQVAYMLDAIVEYRARAETLSRKLNKYVANDRNLKIRYDRFIATGGITGDGFRALIERGRQSQLVNRRGALRLVVNNKPPAKRKIRRRMLNREKMNRNKRG